MILLFSCFFQLDFQLTKWGSPSIDVSYLLYMVASDETRESHRDEVVQFYYIELVKALKDVGFMTKPPGVLELNVELLKNGFLEVLIAVCFLPFFYLDIHSFNIDVAYETGVEGTNLRRSLYASPDYKQMITKVMSDFLYKGFLNQTLSELCK